MQIYKNAIIWAGLALFFAACNNTQPTESKYDKIATGFCECTAQLVELNKKAVALAADSTGQAAQMFKQMESEYNKARECSATIIGQFGKLKKEEFEAVEKAMAGKCPDLNLQKELLREMLGE